MLDYQRILGVLEDRSTRGQEQGAIRVKEMAMGLGLGLGLEATLEALPDRRNETLESGTVTIASAISLNFPG